MQVQMQKWGNSLAVRMPKSIAEDAKFALGEKLDIDVDANGVVRLRRSVAIPTLAQLVAQISPENRYAELSWGQETAREAVEW